VEEKNLELAQAQFGPIPLIAPIDGIVSSVLHREGESVPAGEAVVTVSALTAEKIVAFIRQPLGFEARVDQPVEVRSRSVGRKVGLGKILSVGTQLEPILGELLPPRGATGSSAPLEYGLPILVSIPAGVKILPGEIVDLQPRID
jgi:multidrug resistance efflux pump